MYNFTNAGHPEKKISGSEQRKKNDYDKFELNMKYDLMYFFTSGCG